MISFKFNNLRAFKILKSNVGYEHEIHHIISGNGKNLHQLQAKTFLLKKEPLFYVWP